MEVTFLPHNRKIQVNKGENLFHIARSNGLEIEGNCSGNRTCGKCKVLVTKGNYAPTKEELLALSKEELEHGIRLACCFHIMSDSCVIIDVSPTVKKPEGIGTKESEEIGTKKPEEIGTKKPEEIRKSKDYTTFHPATNKEDYGVAIDIGTTTVVAQLWRLSSRDMIGEISTRNPQIPYGADVISRLTYVSKSLDNYTHLLKLIRTCCSELIKELATRSNVSNDSIKKVVIVSNTIMHHIFSGKSIEGLRGVPFGNVSYEGIEFTSEELDFHIAGNGVIYMMPCIKGYVGSDTLGCIIAKDLDKIKGVSLLIDIGTNGEIVFVKDNIITVCSTAAGPAFEGAVLSHGMSAKEGAITNVKIVDNRIKLGYIGSDNPFIQPKGICGSGVVEALSEFYGHGWVDATGRLMPPFDKDNYVTLWSKGEGKVLLTQKDIREIQLAKGAIYSGIMLILMKEHISLNEIARVYLAGAFGVNIDVEKSFHIGLLPKVNTRIVETIGNAAIMGAAKLLLGHINIEEVERISSNCNHLELATCTNFNEEFIAALSFPV